MENETICIYGCGECGIQLYFLLKERGIPICFFGDLDEKKAGYVIDGLFCRTFSEILRMKKKNVLLIVAVAHSRELCIEFQKLGFENVIYYKDVMKAIYADIKKKDFDRFRSINIEELRNLKQNIEMLMCQDLSIKDKRNNILELFEK